jgi:hypothetical protein
MGGVLHEAIVGKLDAEIIGQLLLIRRCDNSSAADFAQKVEAWRSGMISLGTEGRHHPDGSFGHEDASYPGLLIEVSHSQKRKDLPFLADDYILGSNGLIQVVIGIDLEYRKKKGMEAKVIVWRPGFVDGKLEASQTFESTFRAEDGSLANEDKVLRIQLKDFGNRVACPGIDDISGEIVIPFSQLYNIAQAAERRKRTTSQKQEMDQFEFDIPEEQKRRRVRSPPQQLRPEDEQRFTDAEEKDEQRRSDQDSDYAPGQ